MVLSRWWFAAALASPIIRGRQAETAVSVKRHTHWLRSQMQFDMCPSSAKEKRAAKADRQGKRKRKKKKVLDGARPVGNLLWHMYLSLAQVL